MIFEHLCFSKRHDFSHCKKKHFYFAGVFHEFYSSTQCEYFYANSVRVQRLLESTGCSFWKGTFGSGFLRAVCRRAPRVPPEPIKRRSRTRPSATKLTEAAGSCEGGHGGGDSAGGRRVQRLLDGSSLLWPAAIAARRVSSRRQESR